MKYKTKKRLEKLMNKKTQVNKFANRDATEAARQVWRNKRAHLDQLAAGEERRIVHLFTWAREGGGCGALVYLLLHGPGGGKAATC